MAKGIGLGPSKRIGEPVVKVNVNGGQPSAGRVMLALLLVSALMLPNAMASVDTGDAAKAGRASRAINEKTMEFLPQLFEDVDNDQMKVWLENLTGLGTRFLFTEQNKKAVEYIRGELEAMGYTVESQPFNYTYGKYSADLENLIVTKKGRAPFGYYMVGAHMDSMNHSAFYDLDDPNAPAPGGDDNAGGLAALLMIAKIFTQFDFEETVKFIFTNAEEMPESVGAYRYVEKASVEGHDIKGYLNVDMVCFNDLFSSMDVVYTDDNPDSSPLLFDYVFPINERFGLIDHLRGAIDPRDPLIWGDNEPFTNAGYKALAFVENVNPRAYWYPYYRPNTVYHTADDTLARMNLTLLGQVTNLSLGTLASWAGPQAPDVVPKDLVVNPRVPLENMTANVSVNLYNEGNADALSIGVDLIIDGLTVNRTTIDLEKSLTRTISFGWLPAPGNHELSIVVNRDLSVHEWNVSNDVISIEVLVKERPDVEVVSVDATEGPVMEGTTISVNATVKNHGTQFVDCWVYFKDDGELVGLKAVPLYPDDEWSGTRQWRLAGNGTHRIDVEVTRCNPPDKNESNNMRSVELRANGAPMASLSTNAQGSSVQTLTKVVFSGDGSYDDDAVSQYLFDYGDDTASGWISSDRSVHAYARDGTYVVNLSVKDTDGAVSDVSSVLLTVTDRPPDAIAWVETGSIALVGDEVVLNATGSRDRDGEIMNFTWDLAEGVSASGPVVVRTFSNPGWYNLTLTVTDDDGSMSMKTVPVQVIAIQPTAVLAGPIAAYVGEPVMFLGHRSFSTRPGISDLTYYWDLGDGTSSEDQNPVHVFSSVGVRTVKLTVEDRFGGRSEATMVVDVKIKGPEPAQALEQRPGAPAEPSMIGGMLGAILVAMALASWMRSEPPRGQGRAEGGSENNDEERTGPKKVQKVKVRAYRPRGRS